MDLGHGQVFCGARDTTELPTVISFSVSIEQSPYGGDWGAAVSSATTAAGVAAATTPVTRVNCSLSKVTRRQPASSATAA